MDNRIIVLCGFQASGKDTLASELKKRGFNFVVSHTTRPIRPNESEGNPYYFINKDTFKEMIEKNEFIEYRTYNTLVDNIPNTWYYGVSKNSIDEDKSYVVVLDPQGLEDFKKEFPNRINSYYIEIDKNTRRERAMSRAGFNLHEYDRRERDDAEIFENIYEKVDGIIENNKDINTTLKSLLFRISMEECGCYD